MPRSAPPSSLAFSDDDKADLFQGVPDSTPWTPTLLELDIWFVWALVQ